MLTGARNALQCAEDLTLKSYVAARCAGRLLDAECDQPLCIASLEQKVHSLEEEKVLFEASSASAETELQAARREAEAAKAEAAELRRSLETKALELKDAKCREQASSQAVNAYREAVRAGAESLQRDIAAFLETMRLSPPDLSPTANSISIFELFRWLRACVSMATSGNCAMGDLSAAVAVRSLSAAICQLLPEGGGADSAMTKAQLRSMRDPTFVWPSLDEVRPETLPCN